MAKEIENNNEQDFGPDYLTLIDEEGVEYEVEVLGTVEVGGKDYIALCDAGLPDDAEALEITIMQAVRNEDDTVDFVAVEDEDEIERAYAAFLDEIEDDEDDE